MTFQRALISSATVALVIAAPAMASKTLYRGGEAYSLFDTESGWEVWANETTGGCFLQDRENYGNLVQMGLRTDDTDSTFIGVWNDETEILAPGEEIDVTLKVDGTSYPFVAKANMAPVSEGHHGAYIWVDNQDFISDVYAGTQMQVNVADSVDFIVDLEGTRKALDRAADCYAMLNS